MRKNVYDDVNHFKWFKDSHKIRYNVMPFLYSLIWLNFRYNVMAFLYYLIWLRLIMFEKFDLGWYCKNCDKRSVCSNYDKGSVFMYSF